MNRKALASLVVLWIVLTIASPVIAVYKNDFYAGGFLNIPARGIKADISAPATTLQRYTLESNSNWVMVYNPSNASGQFMQVGWRVWQTTTPVRFYEFCSSVVGCNNGTFGIHNWGESHSYLVSWSSGTTWCPYADAVNPTSSCKNLGIGYPLYSQVFSEMHYDPRNDMGATFNNVNYLRPSDGLSVYVAPTSFTFSDDYPYTHSTLTSSFVTYRQITANQNFGPIAIR